MFRIESDFAHKDPHIVRSRILPQEACGRARRAERAPILTAPGARWKDLVSAPHTRAPIYPERREFVAADQHGMAGLNCPPAASERRCRHARRPARSGDAVSAIVYPGMEGVHRDARELERLLRRADGRERRGLQRVDDPGAEHSPVACGVDRERGRLVEAEADRLRRPARGEHAAEERDEAAHAVVLVEVRVDEGAGKRRIAKISRSRVTYLTYGFWSASSELTWPCVAA